MLFPISDNLNFKVCILCIQSRPAIITSNNHWFQLYFKHLIAAAGIWSYLEWILTCWRWHVWYKHEWGAHTECVLFLQHQEKAPGQGDTTKYGLKKAEMDWIWNIYELNSCCKARLQLVSCTYSYMQSYIYWNILKHFNF